MSGLCHWKCKWNRNEWKKRNLIRCRHHCRRRKKGNGSLGEYSWMIFLRAKKRVRKKSEEHCNTCECHIMLSIERSQLQTIKIVHKQWQMLLLFATMACTRAVCVHVSSHVHWICIKCICVRSEMHLQAARSIVVVIVVTFIQWQDL